MQRLSLGFGRRFAAGWLKKTVSGGFRWLMSWVNIQKSIKKSPCLMGKSTINLTIFNSYVKLPEGNFGDSQNKWGAAQG